MVVRSLEFIPIDPTFPAEGSPDPSVIRLLDALGDEEEEEEQGKRRSDTGQASAAVDGNRPKRSFFQWWFIDGSNTGVYRGADETLEYAYQQLRRLAPVHGVLGFSQGAVLASVIAALAEQGDPRFAHIGFVILVCGFSPRDRRFAALFDPLEKQPLSLPSLHLVGREDTLHAKGVEQARKYYRDPTLLEFSEGHRFPRLFGSDPATTQLLGTIQDFFEKRHRDARPTPTTDSGVVGH
eukprot:GHVU01165291.1.p1 GENE.GHVU01165291.1~~GHVU01165291.1.p1  ORF type:complete len:238 (+),score=43.17 GHVU01165291.1:930-1643(+)